MTQREADTPAGPGRRSALATLLGAAGVAALGGCEDGGAPDPEGDRLGRTAATLTGTSFAWASWIGTAPDPGADKNLRNLTGAPGQVAVALGYYNPGDGGGGVFYWDDTGKQDDGGTIINAGGFGSTSAGWRRVYTGPLCVKWFGAAGDGIQDDRAAIRQAIDAASTGGTLPVRIYLPSGTYLLGGTLKIAARGLCLVGDGPSTILRPSSASFDVITLAEGAQQVRIADLQIQGAAIDESTGQFGVHSPMSARASQVTIEGVLLGGTNGTTGLNNGIKNDTGSQWRITGCTFTNLIGTSSGHGYGVLLGTTDSVVVERCFFFGAPGQGRHAVYLSGGATRTIVADNVVSSFNEAAFPISSYTGQPPNEYNRIQGNTILQGGQGSGDSGAIEIYGISSYNEVVGNTISGFNGNGIIITDGGQGGQNKRNKIVANSVEFCAWVGIYVKGASETSVLDNIVHDCSQAGIEIYSGLRVESWGSAPLTTARDNRFLGNSVAGVHMRSAFNANNTAPMPTGTVLTGNSFAHCALYSVEIMAGVSVKQPWNFDEDPGAIRDHLTKSVAWSTGVVANETTIATTLSLPGAAPGDVASVSLDGIGPNNVLLSATVPAADTVRLVLRNASGSAQDFSGTARVIIWKVSS